MDLRYATIDDAEAIREIYGYYVENYAVSFEYDVPTVEDFKGRIGGVLEGGYPYVVAVSDGNIVGFSYAAPLRKRAAYAHSAEITIYVKDGMTRGGIGHLLYGKVEGDLKKKGITNVYSCVAYKEGQDEHLTDRSKCFHEKMGYKVVGRFNNCGKKFDTFYDILWMEKII